MQGSPLEQFAVYKITFLGYSAPWFLTNFLCFALIVLGFVAILFSYGSSNSKIVPDRWGGFIESYYVYVYNLIKENSGVRAQVFFPFLSTVFFFILTSNLLGMFPFGYALTSQILITFLFSCSIFLGTIFLGLRRHGINFFSLFFPSGSPTYMAFLLVPIELLSFVARPFSLGIRLFANMLAGHVLLKILSTFILIGVFSVQTLDASSTSWVFKEGWVAEKLWPGQLNKPGNTYVGADKPGLVELTRIYSQPRVFDFSEEFERASQYQANKHKPGFEIISSIDPRKTLSPVDTGVRIGKYELQKEVPNGTFCTTSECPDLYRDALKNIFKEQPFDVKDMDSPEFQKRLRELWEAGPRPPQNPCTPEGPSSEFWRWFLYGAFEKTKRIEFSSLDDPNLWRYMDIIIRCPPPKSTSFIEFSMNGFKEATESPPLTENAKHFPFIYGLPHINKGILFSFSVPFSLLFNFFLNPILLASKGLVVAAQIGLLLAFVILELGIAFLQAYVFIILTTIYINDSLQLH